MEDDCFETLVVLQFTSSTPTITKEWFLSRVVANLDEEEGPNLLARFDTDVDAKVSRNSSQNDLKFYSVLL